MKYTWLMLALILCACHHVTAEIQYVSDENLAEINNALSGTIASLVVERITVLNEIENNRTVECQQKQYAIVADCKTCREACRVQVTPEEDRMEQQGAQDAQDITNSANALGSAALEAILGSASENLDRFGGTNNDFVKKIAEAAGTLKKTGSNIKTQAKELLKAIKDKAKTGIKTILKQLGTSGKQLLKGSLKVLENTNKKIGKVFKGLGDGLSNVGQRLKDFKDKIFIQPRFRLPIIRTPRLGLPRFSTPRLGLPRLGLPRFGFPRLILPDVRTPRLGLPRLSIPSIRLPRYNIPSISVPRYSIPIVSVPRYNIPIVSVPRYSIPRISVPRYNIPIVSVPRYNIPIVSVPRYSIPSIRYPSYSSPRFGGGWGGGGGWRGRKRDSSCACRMCDILEKSGTEIVAKACGENFFQEQNATINEISSLTNLYNFLSNTQLLIKISMDLSSLLLTDDGYYVKNSNMTIQYPEGVEIDMTMIKGMPYSDNLNTTRIAGLEGPAVFSKLIKV